MRNDQLSRTEIRLILEGLDIVRDRMREEIGPEGYTTEEYNRLTRLQDRLIDCLESTFY